MADEFQKKGLGQAGISAAIEKLSGQIDKSPEQIRKLIADHQDSRYVKIADGLDDTARDGIEELNIPGVGVVPTAAAFIRWGHRLPHPRGVGGDGAGIEGIDSNTTKPSPARTASNARPRTPPAARSASPAKTTFRPSMARPLVLTVNSILQMMTEQALAATCAAHSAKRGEAIVMDPQTGEVLAIANWTAQYPGFDPTNLGDSPPDARRNRAITDPYEPAARSSPFIAGPAFMWA